MTKLVPELFVIDSTKFVDYSCYITSNSSMITVHDVETMWKISSWHILRFILLYQLLV